jgi:alkylation response protein AidB-like acyl-CoA dehydrogenase
VVSAEAFRQQTRDWLEKNCPQSMRGPYTTADYCWGGRNWVFKSEDQRHWLEAMAGRGWTAPEWPREYGGGGLSKTEAKILDEEMARIRAKPPLASFGIWMLGPALLRCGSEPQKLEHLPRICRGEIRWCQGYSEHSAGSDLAGLQTRAEDRGDHFLVTGSKIWISYADKADWIFCLVRTDFDAPKHRGISFLLFDMASSGVSTKPIHLISGDSSFCETYFDNVEVPKGNLVGDLNKGWDIAKYLLTHEREAIGDVGLGGGSGQALHEIAIEKLGRVDGRLAGSGLRSEVARLQIDELAFALTAERFGDEAKAGQGVGAASSMLKYHGAELNKLRLELLMAVSGSEGLGWEGERFAGGELARTWLRSRGNSIEGGTSEIQLNIIAKHILGLPG